jgi:hypothetical protein
LIGLGPSSDDKLLEELENAGCRVGYLTPTKEWFTEIPIRLLVQDGVCLNAKVVAAWENNGD